MSAVRASLRANRPVLLKTLSYYLMHIVVAAVVAYAVTGDWLASITLSLLEPTVQAFAFFFHEKAWARAARRRQVAQAVEEHVQQRTLEGWSPSEAAPVLAKVV